MKGRGAQYERQRPQQKNLRTQCPYDARLAPAYHGDVTTCPIGIRNADITTVITAGGNGRLPELDLFEVFKTIDLATFVSQQFITCASGWSHRDRAKPSSDITLHFRINRVFDPLVGAIGMGRVDMQHGGVRPVSYTHLTLPTSDLV